LEILFVNVKFVCSVDTSVRVEINLYLYYTFIYKYKTEFFLAKNGLNASAVVEIVRSINCLDLKNFKNRLIHAIQVQKSSFDLGRFYRL